MFYDNHHHHRHLLICLQWRCQLSSIKNAIKTITLNFDKIQAGRFKGWEMWCLPFVIEAMTISCKRFSPTICLQNCPSNKTQRSSKVIPHRVQYVDDPSGDIRRAPQSFRAATTVTTMELGPRCIQNRRPHNKKGLDHWGRKKGLRDNTRVPEKKHN